MAMSHRPEDDHGEVGDAQAAWFAARLADYERRGWFRLAAGHHPPAAAQGFDTQTLRDANAVDLTLGRRLELLVAGYGEDAATTQSRAIQPRAAGGGGSRRHQLGKARFQPSWTETARLRHSGVPVVSCHPAHPAEGAAGGTVRYQVLLLDRAGLNRWDRRFSPRAGGWRADDRRATTGAASFRLRWQSASATFPKDAAPEDTAWSARPGRSAGDDEADRPGGGYGVGGGDGGDGADELDGRVVESFADRVAQITGLRHRDARVALIEAAGAAPAYLRVTVADGPVVEQHPVGVHEAGIDAAVVDAFVEGVHDAYAATDQQLVSDLVYGGEPAEPALVRRAQSRGVRLRSFVEYQGLLDLRDYVRRQSAKLAADRRYPPALYLPQRYRLLDDAGGEVRTDLLGRVVDWLTSDAARFVLVLGDFGRGKTFLLHELARTLPRARPHLTPVLVDLRAMEKAHTVDELVAAHLVAAGQDRFDVRAFRYMLRSGRIVLLFDGFDELALRVTYETAAEHLGRLLDAVEGQAKIVVTSRTQHFLSHGQVRSALGTRVELLPASKLAEVEDFTEEQIREFLVRLYDGDAPRAAHRLALIHDIRDLLGLAHNPRMLGFIAALDESRLHAAQAGTGTISSADLYRALVGAWLGYEEERGRPHGAAPTLTAAERRDAVTALALKLWQAADRLINVGELASTTGAALASMSERGLDEGQAAHMIGAGSLLVRTEDGAFTFIHQSVMEYLVAAAAADQLGEGGGPGGSSGSRGTGGAGGSGGAGGDVLSSRAMSPLMADFFCGAAGRTRAAAWAGRALAEPDASQAARRNALAVARATDRAATRGARLAGAALVGVDLGDFDLTGADLTGADLADARFVRTDLTGAVLRGARLRSARFEHATLAGADLTGADLTGARLVETDLAGAAVAASTWNRAGVLGAGLDDAVARSPELAAAAIPGRDPARPRVDPAGPVCATRYSPDGTLLAYGMGSAAVVVEVATGSRVATLTGHRSRVWSVAFAPDGRMLASGSDDRTCRVWDLATGTATRVLPSDTPALQSVVFTPDGRRLAVSSGRNAVALTDVATGATVFTIAGPVGFAYWLTCSPDGRHLATAGADGAVMLWDAATGAQAATLSGHAGTVRTAAFSPDATMLATGDDDGAVCLWRLGDGRDAARVFQRFDLRSPVLAVAFSPDGAQLAVGGKDRTLQLWDLTTGEQTAVLTGHLDWIWSAAYSPDGRQIVTGSGDGTVRLWDAGSGAANVLTSRTDWVWAVAFSPDGRHVAAGGDGTVGLWDTATGTRTAVLAGHAGPVRAVEFSPDGGILAAGGGDGTVRLWDTAAGAQRAALTGHPDNLMPLAFAPRPRAEGGRSGAGGIRLATGSGNTVRIWDAATGSRLETFDVDLGILTVAFSPDGARLAVAGTGGVITVRDVAAGTQTTLSTPSKHWSVQFSPDGAQLASCGDGVIHLWNTATGALEQTLTGHVGSTRSVAFSPDGARLAAGGVDATILLWDSVAGTLAATLAGHTGTVRSVAFSPDGTRLASGADDGTMRIWDLDRAAEIAAFTSFREGGSAALFPDGSYKLDGDPAGALWWSMKLARFEPGELDRYLPDIRRLPADAPMPPPPPTPA
jgi:WD40 repeat protein